MFLSFDKNIRFFVIRLGFPDYEIFVAESLKQVFFERSFGYALFAFSAVISMDYKSQTCCFTGHRNIAQYTPDTVFEQTKTLPCLFLKVSNASAQAVLWGLIPLLHRLFCR